MLLPLALSIVMPNFLFGKWDDESADEPVDPWERAPKDEPTEDEAKSAETGSCALAHIEKAWAYSDRIFARSIVFRITTKQNLGWAKGARENGQISAETFSAAEGAAEEAKLVEDEIHDLRQELSAIDMCNMAILKQSKEESDHCDSVKEAVDAHLQKFKDYGYEAMQNQFLQRFPGFRESMNRSLPQTLKQVEGKRKGAYSEDPLDWVKRKKIQCAGVLAQGNGAHEFDEDTPGKVSLQENAGESGDPCDAAGACDDLE